MRPRIIFAQPISTPILAPARRRVVPTFALALGNPEHLAARRAQPLQIQAGSAVDHVVQQRQLDPAAAPGGLEQRLEQGRIGQPSHRRFDRPPSAVQLGDDGRPDIRKMRLDVHDGIGWRRRNQDFD